MSKILGIDYGSKHIGLAISDEQARQGFPYLTLKHEEMPEKLEEVIKTESVAKLVIGLPLTLSGEVGPQAQLVKAWAEKLRYKLGLPVEFEDERLTSKMAQALAKQKGAQFDEHQLAAQEILQSYLDRTNQHK